MKCSKTIILTFIIFVITFIWFKEGLLFATAEEGAPFYSLTRTAEIYKDVWVRWGTGLVYSVGLPLAFSAKAMSLLEIFLNNVQIQAFVFFFLVFSGIYGVYLLSLKLIKNNYSPLFSGLFYFFNLFSMSQVWRRSLYVGMFAWSFLPIFTYLSFRFIGDRKTKYLFLLVLFNFMFLWLYSNPGYVFSFIAVFSSLVIYLFLKKKDVKEKFGVVKKTLILSAILLTINIWWIYPYLYTSKSTYTSYSNDLSFESLKGVSVSSPISEVLLLRQRNYFNLENNPELPSLSWGTWYDGVLPRLISLVILAITIYGVWSWRKKNYFRFLIMLSLIGLFISKGVNSPFGYSFYKWLFSTFPFTSALRNPYEKFGIVWLLPYSIFFGIGLSQLSKKFKRTFRPLFTSGILIIACGILVWPLWTAKVFENYSFVKIPKDYEVLNDYLKKDEADSRILLLPMVPDHGARFIWGYRGIEPSEFLFDKVTISKQIGGGEFYAAKYLELKEKLENKGDLETILSQMNIKYLVVRYDLDWQPIGAISPEQVESLVKEKDSITFVKEFGDLRLYEFTQNQGEFITAEGEDAPMIEYNRISPTNYEVAIRNAQKPFNLIFKETFNNNWLTKIDGNDFGEHFVAYDYANGWIIDKKGDYEIEILFKVWPWE